MIFSKKDAIKDPIFTLWQRKSNKTDNNWHKIGDPLPLFNGELGLQKEGRGEIFY